MGEEESWELVEIPTLVLPSKLEKKALHISKPKAPMRPYAYWNVASVYESNLGLVAKLEPSPNLTKI